MQLGSLYDVRNAQGEKISSLGSTVGWCLKV